MGQYKYSERDGYDYISDNGIEYELVEGISLMGESTSDLIIMIFPDEDAVFNGLECVDMVFGATFMDKESYRKDVLETLDKYAEKFEQEHPEIVEYYGTQSMMKEIRKTVDAYLTTNREVLSEHQIKKLEKQLKFLDEC